MAKLKYSESEYLTKIKITAQFKALNPSATDIEVRNACGLSDFMWRKIKKDDNYLELFEKNFNRWMIPELIKVDLAMLREAQEGNVQAAKLLYEKHGKLIKKTQIEVKSPFDIFKSQIDDAEVVEFEEDDESIEDKFKELPPRNENNENPHERVKIEKNLIHKRIKKYKKTKSAYYKKKNVASQVNRRRLRKRAEKVGLAPLPPGRPSEEKRKAWIKKLEEMEKQDSIKRSKNIKL